VPHVALTAAVLVVLRAAPETVAAGVGPVRLTLPGTTSARFRGVVAPMAPWTFAAPAIAFALLPSVVHAGRATDGIALTAAVTMLCALAGVLVQPLGRRLDAGAGSARTATTGLLVLVAGLALASLTAQDGATWLLAPSALVLGSAYGLCLVAGLVEIQRIAGNRDLAGMTSAYYTLTYVGFAAPYVLALGAHVARYSILLATAAAIVLATAALVHRRAAAPLRAD
jgi:hypothetical protein